MKATAPLLVLFVLLLHLAAMAQGMATAKMEARAGRVDAALGALANAPKSAEADALRCQIYSSIEKRDQAIAACEGAAAAVPSSSEDALALARVYGDKADHSGALTGMRMVGKIRSNFERAVQLDGNSVDALSDLGEFYVDAPGVAGGGVEKARPLVTHLKPLSPARAHRLAAMIAAKEKNDAAAIQEYQAELAVAHAPEAYVDLANYYRSRKQNDRAAEYAADAIQHDAHHGSDTLDAAALLLDLKLDVKAAQAGLRQYLATPQNDAVARYAKAHVLLGQSLQAGGDTAGAQKEFAAALALAHDYEPALKGMSK